MKIVFPELKNSTIAKNAAKAFEDVEFFATENPDEAAKMLSKGDVDSLISGLDFSSRDVVIACKNYIPLESAYFSSCFVCEKEGQYFVLADGGVNKSPNAEKLYCIVEDSAKTFEAYYNEQPKIAMLSYSTKGSGGKNSDLEKIYSVIEKIRINHPDWIIDGEMQLDAAVNPRVATKKIPGSPIKGDANVLIVPDLNSGNLLYKSLEQFGNFCIAGPIIQGFTAPLADLSRGSTVEDTILTIKVIKKLFERKTL